MSFGVVDQLGHPQMGWTGQGTPPADSTAEERCSATPAVLPAQARIIYAECKHAQSWQEPSTREA